MKILHYALLMLMALSIQTIAQEQPSYEAKSYRDDSGNLFWNLRLPVFVEISPVADMTGALVLNKVKTTEMEKFAHPFKFDGHGVHYIRHFDYESPVKEKEIAFVVNVDGLPPKSSFTLQGAPSYFNKKLYFGKNLQGTLSAIDQMSGVETTQQSVNGTAYATYGQPISFAQEGDFSVKFYSVDHVGNAEKVQSKEFVVDITSPESTHSVNIDHINGTILSPRSLIKLSSSDQSSGVKSIKFMINEGKETPYAREFGLIGLADGNHLLKYGATDQVKNEEGLKQFNFYYDALPPVVTSSLNGDFFVKDGKTYMAKNASFALAATDNKAGVKEIFHSINGGTLQLYSAPVSLPKQGAYNVKFKSVDLVNNQTGLLTNDQLKNIFMDDTAPTIGHSFKGPKYFTRDTVFITKETLVQLFATDNESGVLKIEYQSDANGMQTYAAPFNESIEGFHAIKFSGTDQVKNIRNDQFFYIVDNNGPEIFYHLSLDKIGTQHLDQKAIDIPVFASGTSFYLAATDKLVGTKSIYYQIDNTPEVLYTTPVKVLQKGLHAIKIKAIDLLGNVTEQQVFEFAVQ